MWLVLLYLAAIVAANLSVAYFGPASTIVNAFLFIGLDITTRDMLHERWENKNFWLRMGSLIAVGAALSWLLNRDAGRVALASLIAFAASGLADTVVYILLHRFKRFTKVMGSNVVSAAVDSLVFPWVAFGSFMPLVVSGQFLAKVVGGFVWALVLNRFVWNRPRAAERSQ